MDKTQKYFTLTIVGLPQRLELGKQVLYDSKLVFENLPPKSADRWFDGFITTAMERYRDWKFAKSSSRAQLDLASHVKGRRKPLRATFLFILLPIIGIGAIAQLPFTWTQEKKVEAARKVNETNNVAPTSQEIPRSMTTASTAVLPPSGAITVHTGPDSKPADIATKSLQAAVLIPNKVTHVELAPKINALKTPSAKPVERPLVQAAEEPHPPNAKTPIKLIAPTPLPDSNPVTAKAEVKSKDEEFKSAVVIDIDKPWIDEKPAAAATATAKSKLAVPARPIETAATSVTRRFATPTEIKPGAPTEATAAPKVPQENIDLKPKLQRVTVVDLAPDGSYALVTNPETRLPQKYVLGQRIHTGEIIQKIEPKSGKLVLDTRTVSME